jgi:hypothetical protein
MKKLKLSLTLFLTIMTISFVSAQEGVSKAELLKGINNFDELGLSSEKSNDLKNYNNGFADKVYSIVDGKQTDEYKINALKSLRNDTAKDLTDILGVDNFKKYKKVVKKELRPLKRKTKLLKFII